jgi:hypothetical protein
MQCLPIKNATALAVMMPIITYFISTAAVKARCSDTQSTQSKK